MRKYIAYIATLCLLISYNGVAQRNNVRAADRLLQSDNPNYSEIRRLLKEATSHEETKSDPYTYYMVGLVDHNLYRSEFRKLVTPGLSGDTARMFRSVVAEIDGWVVADSLERRTDKDGRINIKYLRKIQDYLKEDGERMYSAGLFWLDRKDYKEAVRSFTAALTAQRICQSVGINKLPADSTTANLAYYALISAYTGKLYPEVINLSNSYLDRTANQNEAYQLIARSYLALGDTTGAVPILERGAKLFPETTFFFGTMISIYQAQGKYDQAVTLIDKALEVAPMNPNLLVLRGNVYFLAKDWTHATEVYKKVLQHDPNNYDALFNLGQVYYNNAVSLLANPLATKLDEHKAKEYFRQSLPHLEAAYKLSPDQVRELLGNVYYRLGLEKRYEELHNEAKK